MIMILRGNVGGKKDKFSISKFNMSCFQIVIQQVYRSMKWIWLNCVIVELCLSGSFILQPRTSRCQRIGNRSIFSGNFSTNNNSLQQCREISKNMKSICQHQRDTLEEVVCLNLQQKASLLQVHRFEYDMKTVVGFWAHHLIVMMRLPPEKKKKKKQRRQ